MTSSASSSTQNPPRKLARTNVIDISSNESSPLQENNLTTTTINTSLALSLTPPNASQTPPSEPIKVSTLAPRTLLFSTPPSSPHPFLNSLDDLPPKSTNPPPPPLDQAYYQTLPHTTLMDFKPSISPTNLSRRSSGRPVPSHQEGRFSRAKDPKEPDAQDIVH
nr:hypothetical protein [Tanacetum cinerariifolium]